MEEEGFYYETLVEFASGLVCGHPPAGSYTLFGVVPKSERTRLAAIVDIERQNSAAFSGKIRCCGCYNIICRILEQLEGVDPKIKEWADAMERRDLLNPDGFRGAMRDWWRDNEQFCQEKNYQAIRVGHLFSLPTAASDSLWPASLTSQSTVLPPQIISHVTSASSSAPSFLVTPRLKITGLIIPLSIFAMVTIGLLLCILKKGQ